MGHKFLATNHRIVDRRDNKVVRTPVVLFCLGLILVMVSIVMVPMFKKDTTPVLQNAVPANNRSHDAKAEIMAKRAGQEQEVIEVVDKGASFNMIGASSNQPIPMAESEILARQKIAREAQK